MTKKNQDIRWLQRFNNYKKAFLELESEIEQTNDREFSQLEKKGLIQSFEMVQELAWKVLKDFLEYLGHANIKGSRDAFSLSNETGIIKNSDILLETIESRNNAAHTYNEAEADEIFYQITESYYDAFNEVYQMIQQEINQRKLN